MAVIVVGGSGKDVGKTALMCAVIAALRELDWTAVKISGHDYEPECSEQILEVKIWEETRAGTDTDTARYLAAGARRALLVSRTGAQVPVEDIQRAVGADRNVIYESNRIVDVIKPDVCLALVAEHAKTKASFVRLLRVADAVVNVGEAADEVPTVSCRFRLKSVNQLSPEIVNWLRERLSI